MKPGWPPGTAKRGQPAWRPPHAFGLELRRLREAAGWSLRAAAAQVGVSFSYLAKLEVGDGTRPPALELIAQLADLYAADASALFQLGALVPSPSLLAAMLRAAGTASGSAASDDAQVFAQVLRAYAAGRGVRVPSTAHFGTSQRETVLGVLRWAAGEQGHEQVRVILGQELEPPGAL